MRYFTVDLRRENVSLIAYLLLGQPGRAELSAARPVMLVCPGGGYTDLVPHEDEPVALYWAARGYNTFVLRYTVGRPDAPERALEDIAEAVALIRKNASDWNVDPGKIAAIGFSAGAHLCAMLAACWDKPSLAEYAGCESKDVRLDAVVCCYTPDGMIGESPSESVRPGATPMFLMHTFEDQIVDVRCGLSIAKAYADAGVPFELHVFEKGRHGVTLGNEMLLGNDVPDVVKDVSVWPSLAANWLSLRFGL